MRQHGFDPSANWSVPTAEEIEQLRAILKKTYADQLSQREREIDDEFSGIWEEKDARLQAMQQDEADAVAQEMAVKDKLAKVTDKRDDLDAEIKALMKASTAYYREVSEWVTVIGRNSVV